VQGELTTRTLDPLNWGKLWSTGWGRSELAAELYDEILFNGATFADLYNAGGPAIAVSATDLATVAHRFCTAEFRCHVRGSAADKTLARRRGIVGSARGTIADNDQQLRWWLRLSTAT